MLGFLLIGLVQYIYITEKEFAMLKKYSTKYYDGDEDSEEFEDCEKLEKEAKVNNAR